MLRPVSVQKEPLHYNTSLPLQASRAAIATGDNLLWWRHAINQHIKQTFSCHKPPCIHRVCSAGHTHTIYITVMDRRWSRPYGHTFVCRRHFVWYPPEDAAVTKLTAASSETTTTWTWAGRHWRHHTANKCFVTRGRVTCSDVTMHCDFFRDVMCILFMAKIVSNEHRGVRQSNPACDWFCKNVSWTNVITIGLPMAYNITIRRLIYDVQCNVARFCILLLILLIVSIKQLMVTPCHHGSSFHIVFMMYVYISWFYITLFICKNGM